MCRKARRFSTAIPKHLLSGLISVRSIRCFCRQDARGLWDTDHGGAIRMHAPRLSTVVLPVRPRWMFYLSHWARNGDFSSRRTKKTFIFLYGFLGAPRCLRGNLLVHLAACFEIMHHRTLACRATLFLNPRQTIFVALFLLLIFPSVSGSAWKPLCRVQTIGALRL